MNDNDQALLASALMPAVWAHIDRCNNAPNEATRFAEHAQALGLLEAITILESPCSPTPTTPVPPAASA